MFDAIIMVNDIIDERKIEKLNIEADIANIIIVKIIVKISLLFSFGSIQFRV